MSKSASDPVPFTVIGGFLGSGKTTLLNHLLAEPSGVRYAVLVNDFGELNIDESLVNSHEGQTISLTNGCVCCSIANDFIETMINLVKRLDEFDHVVVEASGVSEPEKIMDIARIDPELIPNGIVVLVDAAEVRNHFEDPYVSSVVHEQLKTAEMLIINKTDLVNQTQLLELEEWLEKIAPSVMRLKTSNAQIPPGLIFGISPSTLSQTTFSESNNHPNHGELPFHSIALQSHSLVNRTEFEQWCLNLPSSVIRGKGTFCFQEDPQTQWIWQKVGHRETLKGVSAEVGSSESKAILIGTEEMPSAAELGIPEGLEEFQVVSSGTTLK